MTIDSPRSSIHPLIHSPALTLPHPSIRSSFHSSTLPACGGVYMLLVRVRRAGRIALRRHTWEMRAGWYVYVGSAQRGLRARIARHLRAEKRVHWHIDYLLQLGSVAAVKIMPGAPRTEEARLARAWCGICGATPVPGFGASDSPAASHLVYFRRRADVERQALWQQAERCPTRRTCRTGRTGQSRLK